jgi:hypothetical protein
VHDAGWAQLLRLIEEKAVQHGREFRPVGRFVPTSQVCSQCGANDGPKPLPFLSFPGAFDRDELETAYRKFLIDTVSAIVTLVSCQAAHRPRLLFVWQLGARPRLRSRPGWQQPESSTQHGYALGSCAGAQPMRKSLGHIPAPI